MPSNVPDFRFNLPLLPHQRSFTNKLGQKVEAAVEMDGKPLTGVTGVTIRAGYNGYTNVIMEMQADAAINMSASSMAKLMVDDFDKRMADKMVAIYDEAHREVLQEMEFDGLDIFTQPQAKSRVMMKLLELLVNLTHEDEQPWYIGY